MHKPMPSTATSALPKPLATAELSDKQRAVPNIPLVPAVRHEEASAQADASAEKASGRICTGIGWIGHVADSVNADERNVVC